MVTERGVMFALIVTVPLLLNVTLSTPVGPAVSVKFVGPGFQLSEVVSQLPLPTAQVRFAASAPRWGSTRYTAAAVAIVHRWKNGPTLFALHVFIVPLLHSVMCLPECPIIHFPTFGSSRRPQTAPAGKFQPLSCWRCVPIQFVESASRPAFLRYSPMAATCASVAGTSWWSNSAPG